MRATHDQHDRNGSSWRVNGVAGDFDDAKLPQRAIPQIYSARVS